MKDSASQPLTCPPVPRLAAALFLFAAGSGVATGYPIDGYEHTGIGRLEVGS